MFLGKIQHVAQQRERERTRKRGRKRTKEALRQGWLESGHSRLVSEKKHILKQSRAVEYHSLFLKFFGIQVINGNIFKLLKPPTFWLVAWFGISITLPVSLSTELDHKHPQNEKQQHHTHR